MYIKSISVMMTFLSGLGESFRCRRRRSQPTLVYKWPSVLGFPTFARIWSQSVVCGFMVRLWYMYSSFKMATELPLRCDWSIVWNLNVKLLILSYQWCIFVVVVARKQEMDSQLYCERHLPSTPPVRTNNKPPPLQTPAERNNMDDKVSSRS